jgi:HSP20 family protein
VFSLTGEEVIEMPTLIRRNQGEVAPSSASVWDPFRVMRDVLRWDPFHELEAAGGEYFAPSFDVKENKEGYVFRADLPGVKDEDLEIALTGNRLTISGKREQERREQGETYYATERSYGSFSRAFTLPDGTDGENVKAELKNGVLQVVVPKKPEVQPRKITISKEEPSKAKA